MPLEFYLVTHLVGVFMILLALGGIALHMINGGSRAYASRRFISIIHGLGLLVSFVAGFGMLAKLGIMGALPLWVILKLVIWLILGGIPVAFYRTPKRSKFLFLTVLVWAGFAAYLGIYKPF